MEIELKLLCSRADLKLLSTHPILSRLAPEAPKVERLQSVYFDTPDCFLRERGFGLRVRKAGGRWLQTLKGGGRVSSGLHSREEWELPIQKQRPDLEALLKHVGARSAAGKVLGDSRLETHLEALFSTSFSRTTWQLLLPSGARVEVAMDVGEIKTGAKGRSREKSVSQPISELELELKGGAPDALFEVADELLASVPFRLGHESKAARGYALKKGESPSVRTSGRIILAAGMTPNDAFKTVLEDALAQIQGNEAGVSRGRELESVHQMRVGLRRLRCALRFFASVVDSPDGLASALKWLSSQLGGARDWEVLAEETLDKIVLACPEHEGLKTLAAQSLSEAASHRKVAKEAVESERYARLFLSLGAWKHSRTPSRSKRTPSERGCGQGNEMSAQGAPHAQSTPAEWSHVGEWADHLLARLWKKLLASGESLGEATPEQRHRVRILAKRLRYGCEFFESLYAPKAMKKFVTHLNALQEDLGWLNDASVAEGLLDSLGQSHPKLALHVGFALGWLKGHGHEDRRRLMKQWRRLVRISPPWKS